MVVAAAAGFLVVFEVVVVVVVLRRLVTGSVETRFRIRGREEPVAWRVIAISGFCWYDRLGGLVGCCVVLCFWECFG